MPVPHGVSIASATGFSIGGIVNNGIVYTVVFSGGGRLYREAAKSAKSVRCHSPNVPTCMMTDTPDRVPKGAFDEIITIPRPSNTRRPMYCKIHALQKSPYGHTLFLDADTYVCDDVTPAFSILDTYDFAAGLAPRRFEREHDLPESVPDWFPEPNTGTMFLRKSAHTARLLQEWENLYTKYDLWIDQPALRAAVWQAVRRGMRFYWLPPEYGCRIMAIVALGQKAIILHGRKEDLSITCKRINEHHGIRTYIPRYGLFRWAEWRKRLGVENP